MKRLPLIAALVLSTCQPAPAAEPTIVVVEAPQPCEPVAEARATMWSRYREAFVDHVTGADGVTRELYVNPGLGTFSILEPYGDGQLCFMAYGQSDAFISLLPRI